MMQEAHEDIKTHCGQSSSEKGRCSGSFNHTLCVSELMEYNSDKLDRISYGPTLLINFHA